MGIEGPCVSTHQIRSIFSTTGSIGNGKRRSHRGPLMTDLIRGFALTCQLSRIYPSSLSALEFLHHSKIHSGNTGAYWYKSRRARFSDGRQCSTPRIRWTGSLAHSLVSKENRTRKTPGQTKIPPGRSRKETRKAIQKSPPFIPTQDRPTTRDKRKPQ